jgi:hypothetical protein
MQLKNRLGMSSTVLSARWVLSAQLHRVDQASCGCRLNIEKTSSQKQMAEDFLAKANAVRAAVVEAALKHQEVCTAHPTCAATSQLSHYMTDAPLALEWCHMCAIWAHTLRNTRTPSIPLLHKVDALLNSSRQGTYVCMSHTMVLLQELHEKEMALLQAAPVWPPPVPPLPPHGSGSSSMQQLALSQILASPRNAMGSLVDPAAWRKLLAGESLDLGNGNRAVPRPRSAGLPVGAWNDAPLLQPSRNAGGGQCGPEPVVQTGSELAQAAREISAKVTTQH